MNSKKVVASTLADAIKVSKNLGNYSDDEVQSALLKLKPISEEINHSYALLLKECNLRETVRIMRSSSLDDLLVTDGVSTATISTESVENITINTYAIKKLTGVSSSMANDYVRLQATVNTSKVKQDFKNDSLPVELKSAVTSKTYNQVKIKF